MSTKIVTIPGANFDAGYVPAVAVAVPERAVKTEWPDELLAALSKIAFSLEHDSEASRECQRLLIARAELNRKCSAFVEAQRELARAALMESHEALKAEIRAAQSELDNFRARAEEQGRVAENLSALRAKAGMKVYDAMESRKSLSRYASAAAFQKADAAIAAAEKSFAAAQRAEVEARALAQQMLFVDLRPIALKLDRLKADEADLSAELTGQSYTDRLGIVHS